MNVETVESFPTHLNQQTDYVMFNTTINSNHFDGVSFSKNFSFLGNGKDTGQIVTYREMCV